MTFQRCLAGRNLACEKRQRELFAVRRVADEIDFLPVLGKAPRYRAMSGERPKGYVRRFLVAVRSARPRPSTSQRSYPRDAIYRAPSAVGTITAIG